MLTRSEVPLPPASALHLVPRKTAETAAH